MTTTKRDRASSSSSSSTRESRHCVYTESCRDIYLPPRGAVLRTRPPPKQNALYIHYSNTIRTRASPERPRRGAPLVGVVVVWRAPRKGSSSTPTSAAAVMKDIAGRVGRVLEFEVEGGGHGEVVGGVEGRVPGAVSARGVADTQVDVGDRRFRAVEIPELDRPVVAAAGFCGADVLFGEDVVAGHVEAEVRAVRRAEVGAAAEARGQGGARDDGGAVREAQSFE
mmetsp:Transcript_24619/g.97701  ORF Transcript_24619/g.97701 Transcript_24619/m.97701 type:complete len:225 (+) Transcript_24619:302-976(+)